MHQLVNQFLQGGQLSLLNQAEFLYEINEMLKWRVQMGLLIQVDNVTEVGMINMGVDTKQPLEYCLGYCKKVLWESNT